MSEALKRCYDVHEEIGRGRFGVVFRCSSAVTGDSFAVKSIDKRRLISGGDSLDCRCLLTEPKILHFLSLSPHPNIVCLHGVYEDDSNLHMVLDLCSSSDLHHLIAASCGGALLEADCRAVMVQLMNAIGHIHRLGVVHRDIKPENIVFDPTNRLKLTDFGSAEILRKADGEAAESAPGAEGVVGTPYYVAPEVLAGGEYGEKVDVWSAGVVMYMMLSGFPPFYGETAVEIFSAVLRANLRFPINVFKSVSPAAKDLLRRMLCKDVSRRFSAEQVLRHPWMTTEESLLS